MRKLAVALILCSYSLVALGGPIVVVSKIINSAGRPFILTTGNPTRPFDQGTFIVPRRHIPLSSTLQAPSPAVVADQAFPQPQEVYCWVAVPTKEFPFTKPRSSLLSRAPPEA